MCGKRTHVSFSSLFPTGLRGNSSASVPAPVLSTNPLALSVGQLTVQIKLIKGGDTKIHVLPLPLGFRCKPRRLAAIVSSTSEFLVHRDPDVREEPPLDSANDPVLQ